MKSKEMASKSIFFSFNGSANPSSRISKSYPERPSVSKSRAMSKLRKSRVRTIIRQQPRSTVHSQGAHSTVQRFHKSSDTE
ncbi:hypothetical protein MRB53_011336 [Persea americana]|uniref:Uncharacterized protein n=1 Tax=Persea americana TaxID=3435 RepID=A0ACC2LUQ8_PERAE|nr:hypothetical protein MRB53_011336 [Persea americana]